MNLLDVTWEREVRQSSIVILPCDDSYLKGSDIKVSAIIHQLAFGEGFGKLMHQYPGLTEADLRACMLFSYLRAIQKV
ncbi:hypothetical protein GCM10027578_23370 [Spirosoma luteolum]